MPNNEGDLALQDLLDMRDDGLYGEDVGNKKFKGKQKMDLDTYFVNCRQSLLSHIESMNSARTSAGRIKYQAIINSLLLRLKRREDEELIATNLQ